MEALEVEWRERIAQEEGQGWVAQGCYFLLEADRVHRDRAQVLAMGGLGLLHAYVLEKRHMMQQFAEEATIIEQTHIQMGRDIQAQAWRQVLHLESQGRDRVSSASQAHFCLTLTLLAKLHAILQEEARQPADS